MKRSANKMKFILLYKSGVANGTEWDGNNLGVFGNAKEILRLCGRVRFQLENERDSVTLYSLCEDAAHYSGQETLKELIHQRFVEAWLDLYKNWGLHRAMRALKNNKIYSILVKNIPYTDFVESLDDTPGYIKKRKLINIFYICLAVFVILLTICSGCLCGAIIYKWLKCAKDAYKNNYKKLIEHPMSKKYLTKGASPGKMNVQDLHFEQKSSKSSKRTRSASNETKTCSLMMGNGTNQQIQITKVGEENIEKIISNRTENNKPQVLKESWEVILEETLGWITNRNRKNEKIRCSCSNEVQLAHSEEWSFGGLSDVTPSVDDLIANGDDRDEKSEKSGFSGRHSEFNFEREGSSAENKFVEPGIGEILPSVDSREVITPKQYSITRKVACLPMPEPPEIIESRKSSREIIKY